MTKNKIHNETIKLYEQLEYHKEEQFAGFVGDTKEEIWHPKGLYYHGHSFASFISGFDNEEYIQIFQEIAEDIDQNQVTEDGYKKKTLADINSKQLLLLKKEINFWQRKRTILPDKAPVVENQIAFYTNVYNQFNEWLSNVYKKEYLVTTEIHTKNYTKEAKLYIDVAVNKFPTIPKLKDLEAACETKFKNKISITTWSRRLKDVTFLAELKKTIDDKIRSAQNFNKEEKIEKLERIRSNILFLAEKLWTPESQDIFNKSRRKNLRQDIGTYRDDNVTLPDQLIIE